MTNRKDELDYVIHMNYKPDEALFAHLAMTYTLACMKGEVMLAMSTLKYLNLLLEEYGESPEYMRDAFDRLRRLLAKGHPEIMSCSETGRHCACESLFCCLCGQPKLTFTMEGEVNG